MSSQASSLSQLSNAQLGAPLPLAYGYHEVRGNELINQGEATSNRLVLRVLGEGEWDGIERLWINSKLTDHTNNSIVRFHPGILGTLGAGLSPTSTGGDQGADQFFSLLPNKFQPLTLSGMAYLFCNVPPDPAAPSATLDIIGHFRTCKVRIFDNTGTQTSYAFSTNGAWQILDLILRRMLKPQWNPVLAAAGGGDLTAFEKARIDFPSVVDAAAQCDFAISSGKRFESNVAFPGQVAVRDALDQLRLISQIFVIEAGGKIYIRADQPRASSFTLTRDHVVSGTLKPDKQYLHGAVNQWIVNFRDTNPKNSADIETPGNGGLARSNGVITVKTKLAHPYVKDDNVQIIGASDASFNGVVQVTSIPSQFLFTANQAGANTSGAGNGYTGTPESRFATSSIPVNHEQHQLTIGPRGLSLTPAQHKVQAVVDLGGCTPDQARRCITFLKNRTLGMDQAPYIAPLAVDVVALMDAVDPQSRSLIEQLQGDVITIDPSVSEEFQGDYEIMKEIYTIPGSDGTSGGSQSSSAMQSTIQLSLMQVISGAYSDAVQTTVPLAASQPRILPFTPGTDNAIRNGDFGQGSANWQSGSVGGNGMTGVVFQFAAGNPGGPAELLVPNTAQQVNIESVDYYAIDPTRVYLLECWCKIPTALTGALACYGGLAEYDVNRQLIQHQPGGAGSQQLPVQMSLAAAFNVKGISTNGSTFTNGTGMLGTLAFSANVLGSSQIFGGVLYNFGAAASALNAVKGAGQTITLTSGKYASLRLIMAGLNGNQASQSFTVTYSDTTTQTFVQSVVNITTGPQGFGETQVISADHLNVWDGSSFVIGNFLYEYDFAVNSAKTVASISIPNNSNLIVFAITGLTPDLIMAALFDGLQGPTATTFVGLTNWQKFEVEVTGSGGTNPLLRQFNNATAYVRAAFLFNWGASGTPQQIEIQGVRLSPSFAGARRATLGIDSNGRMLGTFRNNPTNIIAYFTGSNPLTQSGTSTAILVSAFVIQTGDGQVSYSAGSVDPGAYGKYNVYLHDPSYSGGPAAYLVTQNKADLTSKNDVMFLGTITTVLAGGGVGTGGGGGSCFSGRVKVRMSNGGAYPFSWLEEMVELCGANVFKIKTRVGIRQASLVVREYAGPVHVIDREQYVTPRHPIWKEEGWVTASSVWPEVTMFEGKVYTLVVLTEIEDERHFILEDGTVAHNVSNLS